MLDFLFTAPYWDAVYFENSLKTYTFALGAFVFFLVVFKITKVIIILRLKKLAKRTATDIDDAIIAVFDSIKPPFYSFLAFYIALQLLTLNEFVSKSIRVILLVWIIYQFVHAVQIVIDFAARKQIGKEDDRSARAAVGLLRRFVVIGIWAVGILLVLQNLGFNITSLIAGLGIGGIAVALAAQSILGDLFSSFTIFFDKPFVVGDFIIVGEHMGVVEKIGIKSTRIRALQGEEIVISNTELTSTRIQNFKKMKERRISFGFGILYETSQERMKKIPSIVKKIIKDIDGARFDRAHFKKFGDSSLDFEVVYYVKTGDYNEYMNIQEDINLKIKGAFAKEKISMAYPTRTLYIQNEE